MSEPSHATAYVTHLGGATRWHLLVVAHVQTAAGTDVRTVAVRPLEVRADKAPPAALVRQAMLGTGYRVVGEWREARKSYWAPVVGLEGSDASRP
jgi:hypothetical protein